MTFAEIRSAVGRKCSLVDGSGSFVDGLVSEADVLALANARWKELHLRFADKFPEGMTLEFTKNLVDDQEDYEIQEATAIDDRLVYVGIKYDSTATYFTRVRRRPYTKLNEANTDSTIYSQTSPFYMVVPTRETAAEGSSQQALTPTIRLRPIPDANVTNGLFVRFIELPENMVLDSDTPYTLHPLMHSLIVDYVVADVWEIKRDWANSNEALNRATMNEKNFWASYQPTTMDEPVRYDVGKTWNPYNGR